MSSHNLCEPVGPRAYSTHLVLNVKYIVTSKTFNNGSLGSRIDEERSEMR